MAYSRTAVKTALGKAREAGKACDGLSVGLRETELQLETWGFLPLPGDVDTDKRVRDWYVSQGLAIADKGQTSEPVVVPMSPSVASEAALVAAEAALGAASAALALARSMSSRSEERRVGKECRL